MRALFRGGHGRRSFGFLLQHDQHTRGRRDDKSDDWFIHKRDDLKRRRSLLFLVVDSDHGFDGTEFGVGEFVEPFGNFFDVESMSDPDVGVDVAGFDNLDNLAEICRESITRGQEGLLATVEDGGVWEGEVESCDADVDDACGEASKLETGGHGFVRAGGIDDDVGEVAVGHFLELGEVGSVRLEWDAVFDAEVLGAEVEAALDHVHDDDLDVGHEFEELKAGETDGAGTDDEDGFAGLRVAAFDSVEADSEGFNEGEFVVRKVVSRVELAGGNDPVCLTKSTGAVNADDLDAGAAIGGSFLGGAGIGIVDVGFKGAFVAGLDVGDAFADGDDFESEFVSRGAGVGEEREFSEVTGEIGAADAHAMGANEGLTGAGCGGIGKVDGGDFFNVGEFDGVGHGGESR